MDRIKVMVVDDSALMRKIISDMINSEMDMEVIDTARNGEELLEKLMKHQPKVITLDIEMPKLDGMQTLKELKKRNIICPVIMLSSISQRGTQLTMECLEAGAFDFLPKPSGSISLDINKVKDELIQKIRLAAGKVNVREYNFSKKEDLMQQSSKPGTLRSNIKQLKGKRAEAVVIGASTGGPKALYTVITSMPQKIGVPIFVVQHMPVGFTKAFAERLDLNSDIKVVEARDGDLVQNDVVYIAPGGFHMEVWNDKRIHLNTEPAVWGVRPAVDRLFLSASRVYGTGLIGAVLTGMGRDGAQGTVEIKNNGGITLAQDQTTSIIYGMPRAAFETGKVDEILPLNEIAVEIIKLVM